MRLYGDVNCAQAIIRQPIAELFVAQLLLAGPEVTPDYLDWIQIVPALKIFHFERGRLVTVLQFHFDISHDFLEEI